MTLHEQIKTDLTIAMKARDADVRDTLRSVDSMIKNEEIAKNKREDGLEDDAIVVIIKRAIKQRKDSAVQYRDGDRVELAQKEESEIKIIEKYLPAQMSEADVRCVVERVIETVGATDKSDMGKVMGLVMRDVGNQVDGTVVRVLVDEILSQ